MLGAGIGLFVGLVILAIIAIFIYYAITKKKVEADKFCIPFLTPCADGLECNNKFKCATAPNPKTDGS